MSGDGEAYGITAEGCRDAARARLLRVPDAFMSDAETMLGGHEKAAHDLAQARRDADAMKRSIGKMMAAIEALGGAPEATADAFDAVLEALNSRYLASRATEARGVIVKTKKDRASAGKATAGNTEKGLETRRRVGNVLAAHLKANPMDRALRVSPLARRLMEAGADAAKNSAAQKVAMMSSRALREHLTAIQAEADTAEI